MIPVLINYYQLPTKCLHPLIMNLEVRSVFLDISKAFDNVCHEGLIFKLKRHFGERLHILSVFFLRNRK